jgi:hypothetical protein
MSPRGPGLDIGAWEFEKEFKFSGLPRAQKSLEENLFGNRGIGVDSGRAQGLLRILRPVGADLRNTE